MHHNQQPIKQKKSITLLLILTVTGAFISALALSGGFLFLNIEVMFADIASKATQPGADLHTILIEEFIYSILVVLAASLVCAFGLFFLISRNLIIKPYTELQLSRRELRDAVAEAEKIVQIPMNNPNPLIQIDVEGNVLFANPSSLELCPDINHKGFESELLKGLQEYADAYKLHYVEIKTRELTIGDTAYSQTVAPVVIDGTKAFVIYCYDITAIKKAQEKARLLETAIESAKDGVLITDTDLNTGPTILYVNDAFTKITGYESHEVIGKTPRMLQGPGTSRQTLDDIRKSLENEKSFQGELLNYSKDGIAYWLDISIVPVRDDDGNVTHYAAIERNITERKAFEKELMITRESAEVASRAKGNFLANMSHELRTPMNGIIGLSKLLLENDMDDESQESLQSINTSAEGLLALLNDLLDFSKIEAGELSLEEIPFNLREAVHQVVDITKPISSKKGLTIDVSYSSIAPTWVKGDPNRIRQVFYNLIGNAIKFTQQGGVNIDVSLFTSKGDEKVRFRIEDTGIGIPDDVKETIFEKFTQADVSTARKFGGTGLGLAITKELVEMMGGRIGVESVVGKGSTFWFDVPFEILEDYKEETQTQEKHAYSYNGYSALVVDDHPTNILFMKKLLKKLKFSHIETAHDGENAVEKCETGKFDIILMDCQMPSKDGFEATREIRMLEEVNLRERTPIIAVTADAMKGTYERCIEAGMDFYITKPISMDQIQEALAQFLNPQKDVIDDIPEQLQATDEIKIANGKTPIDLSHLRQFTDGDPEEEKEFFEIFLDQAGQSLLALQKYSNGSDNEEWKKAAHRFKGSAANLGASDLADLCKTAEYDYEADEDTKVKMMAAIAEELTRVNAFLNTLHA